MTTKTYILTDHWCRHCGMGRIIQLSNPGPTGGGNAIYHCTHCDVTASDICCESLCYCNLGVKNGGIQYFCWSSKEKDYPKGWRLWVKTYNKEILKRHI